MSFACIHNGTSFIVIEFGGSTTYTNLFGILNTLPQVCIHSVLCTYTDNTFQRAHYHFIQLLTNRTSAAKWDTLISQWSASQRDNQT